MSRGQAGAAGQVLQKGPQIISVYSGLLRVLQQEPSDSKSEATTWQSTSQVSC